MASSTTSSTNDKSARRSSYGGPKIKKVKSAVPLNEKQKQGKALDLSFKTTSQLLDNLPDNFKNDDSSIEELRRLDLTGQTRLFKNAGLGPLRFVGGTLTWLNLSGVDCGSPGAMDWLFLKMMQTLFVLTMMNCNMDELPKELASVKSLKALVASHNNLTSPSLSHLTSLPALNSLILSDNQLTSFPSSTLDSLTSLKKISLANNKLTSDGLPSFANISATLEELRLNGNAGIKAIPELAKEGSEESSSLTVLELSHTETKDMEEIKKLQKLPKLVNLGLRDTPLSRVDDYRTKASSISQPNSVSLSANSDFQITEMLPKLRILDNVRFDPLYLARKAKGKEPEQEGPRRGKGAHHKQDKGWGIRSEPTSNDIKGKKRRMDEEDEPRRRKGRDGENNDGDSTRKSSGKSRSSRGEPSEETIAASKAEEASTAHVPARKRSKKNKKAQTEANEGSAPSAPTKAPKAIGGSLSDPTVSIKTAEPETSASTSSIIQNDGEGKKPDNTGLDVKQIPKQLSSVVGVVEVVASTKKPKERSSKGSRFGRKGGTDETSAAEKPDVLALLAQEREKATSIGGWD